MARIRAIKPETWTDEKVVKLRPLARLLFIGTWNFVDDEGRMEYSPLSLKLRILPADKIEIEELVGELEAVKLVRIYSVDGKQYLQVTNFSKHQKIDKRTASRLPIPPKSADFPRITPTPHDGMEGKGKECKGVNKTLASGKPTPDPRKAFLRDALKKGWEWKNPNAGACPWGLPEEVAINALLADVGKDMPGEALVQCVRNKFLSDEAHGSKPRSYIRLLLTYMESPLDRFGKPKSLGANNGRQAIGDKENARRASTVEVLRERAVGRRAGNSDGRDGSELSDRPGTINQKSLPDGMGSDREGQDDRSTATGIDSLPAEPGAEVLPEPKRSSRSVIDSSISPAFRSLRPAVVVP